MKTRHWKLLLHKDHIAITLFVRTTDEMTERDLGGAPEDSLIRLARQYHRRAQGDEQDHRDLAIAAVMIYAATPGFDRDGTHIEAVNESPRREPDAYLGGGSESGFVPVWEEPTNFRFPR